MTGTVNRVLGVMILTVAIAALGFAENPKKKANSDIENIGNRDINKGSINFISLNKEIEMGRELARQVEEQSKLVKDPIIDEYINRIGQNIVRNSDAKVPFTIKVVDSDEVNAFALPGGFFYVNSGLILAADDEAELAGVMAHEIAHVAARHGTKQESKAELLNIASIPLIFVGGPVGYGIRQAAGLLVPMSFLKFSRKSEAEADYLGVQYLYKSGYDPSAMVRFFEKLQAKEKAKPGSVSSLFSSHPPTADRILKVQDTIETILPPAERYVETTSEFDRIKTILAKAENEKTPEDASRPSLRRKTRTPTTDDGDSNDSPDEERPTLKRKSPEQTDSPPTSTPNDDQPPTLKRKPAQN